MVNKENAGLRREEYPSAQDLMLGECSVDTQPSKHLQ